MRQSPYIVAVALAVGLILIGGAVVTRDNEKAISTVGTEALALATPVGANRVEPRPGVGGSAVDPETLRHHATFQTRGRNFHIFSGLVRRDSPMNQSGVPKGGRKLCAVVDGTGFSATTCRYAPFAEADVLLMELAAGGPADANRTEVQIAGLVSRRVARVEVVSSHGDRRAAQVQGGAFLYELPAEDVAAGIDLTSVVAFANDGRLLERVDL